MKKISKRFKFLKAAVGTKTYSIDCALLLLKEIATAKFDESVEAHIALNINPKYANQQLRANLHFPHGIGKQIRIAVLTDYEFVTDALKMGATIAGDSDLLEQIRQKKLDFDILITAPSQMHKLAKLGGVLGPKGLMPSPKNGTVTQNLKESLAEFKKGKMDYRADKGGVVHMNFGKVGFSEVHLKENLMALYSSIEKNKPLGVKGKYVKSFYICTSMSPSIKIDLQKQ